MSVSPVKHPARENEYLRDNPQAASSSVLPSPTPTSHRIVAPEQPPSDSNPVRLPGGPPTDLATNRRARDLLERSFGDAGPEGAPVGRGTRALADSTLGVGSGPTSHSSDADKTLQAELIPKMGVVADSSVTVPERSLISQPFKIFKHVLNQPDVLAWLRGKGFSLDSVTVGRNNVSGFVTRNGVVSRQTYTLQDTSGWWQVSGRVMRALEALDPKHHGVPYIDANSRQLSRNVASEFYAVKPPDTQAQATALASTLEAGWPPLSAAQVRDHELRLEWVKHGINERDDRENLADALLQAADGLADGTPLTLSNRTFETSQTHPLKRDDDARRRLNELIGSPEMHGALEDFGSHLSGQPVRISEGRLQVLQPASNQWLDVPVGERWSQSLKDALAALVVLSEAFGHALYSDARHDLRQVARSMNLDTLDTAGEARAAANWLRTDFAPPALVGNYARLLPQEWAAGTLSATDKSTLAALATDQKYGANTIGTVLGRRIVTQVDPQEAGAHADQTWEQLLNTPEAQEWGQQLARALGWHVRSGQHEVSDAVSKSLVTSAIMLSVDPDVPAPPGTAAGYSFYAPENMGREIGAVRKDFEKYLIQQKHVNPRAAPLVAHLFLAHAAPEFLVKQDLQQPTHLPQLLHLSADKLLIGSPAWMTLQLGAALAEVWGGAGASRGMSLKELGALTRRVPVLPQHQVLAAGLGTKVVLDVGVMTGIVPRRSDGQYTPEDYQKASDGIDSRSEMIEQSIETLAKVPPTRTSLATEALKQAFPDLTDNEIQTLTVQRRATDVNRLGWGTNSKQLTLLEAYATGDLHQNKYDFKYPRITQATFDTRIQSLPKIADQVAGAVDHYLSETKAAMPALMRMSLAKLPFQDRQALEWGNVDIFSLRKETGETKAHDAGKNSKVDPSRGWHGVLLRSQYKGKTRYYEFFPASGRIIDRTQDLSGKKLHLNGKVETIRSSAPQTSSISWNRRSDDYLRGTEQPFDIDAYLNGTVPRPGIASKVIISQVGFPLTKSPSRGQGDNTDEWVPDTFGSARTDAIIRLTLAGNYIGNSSGYRKDLINFANTVLPSEETIRGFVDRLTTKENGRAMLSMISFVGGVADIVEGNVKEGVQSLLIDFLSFAATGGLHASYSAWRAVRRASTLNSQAFRASVFKEGGSLIHGILNPTLGFLELPGQPTKLMSFLRRTRRGLTTKAGMGVFVPVDVFEKARFATSAYPQLSDMFEKARAVPVSAVSGTVNQATVQAVNEQGRWYALDPRNGVPIGPPLQSFIPATT